MAQGYPVGAPSLDGVTTPAFERDRLTVLLYVALGTFGFLQTVPGAVTPALRAEFGYSYTTAGLHLTLYAAGSVLAGLLGPGLDRRLGRHRLLLVGLLGGAAGATGLMLGRALPWTLLSALVLGGLATLVLLTVQTGLSDAHGVHRPVAFSESNVVASVGTTTGPLVVGAGAGLLGSWRWGVLGLVAAAVVVAWLVRHAPLPVAVAEEHDLRGGALPRGALAGIALVFCAVVLEWCVAYWAPTYLRDVVELERSTAVAGGALFFGAMLVGRLAGGVLARRHDPARIVVGALAVFAVGLALQAVGTAPATALVGLAVLGLGVSVLFPMGLSLAVAAAPARAAVISGRCITAGAVAVLLGPLAVGRLADAVGLRAALLVLPVTLAAAVGALVVVRAAVQEEPVRSGRGA